VCMFCGRAGHLDEFCFRRKRIERRRIEYDRNSYHDEFIDFLPRSYSYFLPRSYSRTSPRTTARVFLQFSYGPNYHLYGFGPRENRFELKRFDYDPRPRRSDRLPRRPNFSNGGSFPHYYTCVLPGLGFAFAELSQPRKIAAQVLLLAARFIFH
jgi:hypothetical protein